MRYAVQTFTEHTSAVALNRMSWWMRLCLDKTLKLCEARDKRCNYSAYFSFMTKQDVFICLILIRLLREYTVLFCPWARTYQWLGIPYFRDWKPGHFRTTSLIRQMWFISYLDNVHIFAKHSAAVSPEAI